MRARSFGKGVLHGSVHRRSLFRLANPKSVTSYTLRLLEVEIGLCFRSFRPRLQHVEGANEDTSIWPTASTKSA
jgi:hypothetical protein